MKSFTSKKQIRSLLYSILRSYRKKGCKIEILDLFSFSYTVDLYMPCVSSIFIERLQDEFTCIVSVIPSDLDNFVCLRFDAYKFK